MSETEFASFAGNSVHPLSFCWCGIRVWSSYQIFKMGSLTGSQFLEGGCWERWGWLPQGGCSFYIKIITKIWNIQRQKKFLNKNIFLCQLLLKDGMGLNMKNFNIMGVQWKIQIFRRGEGGSWKTNIWGELPKKGRFKKFADL